MVSVDTITGRRRTSVPFCPHPGQRIASVTLGPSASAGLAALACYDAGSPRYTSYSVDLRTAAVTPIAGPDLFAADTVGRYWILGTTPSGSFAVKRDDGTVRQLAPGGGYVYDSDDPSLQLVRRHRWALPDSGEQGIDPSGRRVRLYDPAAARTVTVHQGCRDCGPPAGHIGRVAFVDFLSARHARAWLVQSGQSVSWSIPLNVASTAGHDDGTVRVAVAKRRLVVSVKQPLNAGYRILSAAV